MRFVLSAVLSTVVGTAAFAAPVQAATSCYGGASLGFSAASTPLTFHDVTLGERFEFAELDATGVSGGLTAGCDWRMNSWVIGAWGDITWHNTDLQLNVLGIPLLDVDIDNQWSLGARAGYFVADNILLYGLVGWTRVETSDLEFAGQQFSGESMNGVVLGGGVEFEIAPNVLLATEYRYTNLGSESVVVDPGFLNIEVEPEIHTARAIVKYRFDVR